MPADLDDLFTELGRHADALPIGTADHIRQRGARRRNRTRAMVACAAAVALVLTGVSLSLRQPRHAEPILPATTPARIHSMAPVGEPLRPSDGTTWTSARLSGTRAIGFSGSEVAAVDTETGATLWTRPALDDTYRGIVTTARAVMLLREFGHRSEVQDVPVERRLEIRDPATGALRWERPHTDRDRFVLHEDVLVQLTDATRRIDAYDLVTGERLWTAAPGADRPELITGMQVEADGHEITTWGSDALFDPASAKAFPFSDDRLVEVTTQGRIRFVDIRTGDVLSTTLGHKGAKALMAYEGMVYTDVRPEDAVHGVASPSRVLYAPSAPWNLDSFFPCGHDRLCVYEFRDTAQAHLVQIDATTGAMLRSTEALPRSGSSSVRLGHVLTSGGGDKATALYDENGQLRYSDNGIGGFIDDGNALTMTREADGRFTVLGISNLDFREVELGSLPELSGRCDWSADLIACPTAQGLTIQRFTR